MPAPQGLFHFTGLADIIAGDFTLCHGISPSVCTLTTVPRPVSAANVGTLTISFGGQRIVLPECAVDSASITQGNGFRWQIRILDRRWKWQFGAVYGRYNLRKKNGDVETETEKSPRDLATILLRAMGEQGFDVSRLPNESRPMVEWLAANPAQELAALCDSLGCRVVLGLNNRVTLWPAGQGKELPIGGTAISGGYGVQAKIRPDMLMVVGGPVVFQTKLALEPVGEDTDGSIVPIDKLSYKPTSGWAGEDTNYFNGVTATWTEDGHTKYARSLALKTVWRWYRITGQAEGGIGPRGVPGRFESIDQLLPLGDTLNETAPDADGIERAKPATIDGVYWPYLFPPGNTPEGTPCIVPFSLDTARGIVQFQNPVFKWITPTTAAIAKAAAEIYLTTTYQVRPNKNDSFLFKQHFRELPGRKRGAGGRVLQHPEIILRPIVRYNKKAVVRIDSNDNEVVAEMNHYIDAALKEYNSPVSTEMLYAGMMAVELDGAICQWSFSCGKNAEATTRIGRNSEPAIEAVPYAEMRRRETAKRIEGKVTMLDELERVKRLGVERIA